MATKANVQFLRKLVADELMDTLFFATGEPVVKTKHPSHWMLSAGKFNVKIVNNRNIVVNNETCRFASEAKWVIQSEVGNVL